MNTYEAKKLSLPDILAKLGYHPESTKKNGMELWYLSPFRSENAPSFHTSYLGGKWIWNDFGDSGGTVIDFIMRYQNYTKVQDALTFLEQLYQTSRITASKPKLGSQNQQLQYNTQAFQIQQITSLNRTIPYLTQTRKLNPQILNHYLKEIYFINQETGKSYFAPGMANRAGGYEIRNPYFKSCIGKKDLTFLKSAKNNDNLIVFEGFINFLSYLTDNNIDYPSQDTLILNSVSFGKQALSLIRENQYQNLQTFFDNDKAGNNLTQIFKDELNTIRLKTMNHLYQNFKDYNDYLVSKK